MILADKIIELRKKAGYSQEELAEKMGVSRSKFIELKTFPKSLQVLKNKKGNPKGSKQ